MEVRFSQSDLVAIALGTDDYAIEPTSYEAVNRGIVTSISVRQVGRFLKGGGASATQEPVLAQRQAQGRGGLRPAGPRRL